MESNTSTDIQVDPKVFMRIVHRILIMEHENLKTQKIGPSEMTDKIYKLIEFEVDKK